MAVDTTFPTRLASTFSIPEQSAHSTLCMTWAYGMAYRSRPTNFSYVFALSGADALAVSFQDAALKEGSICSIFYRYPFGMIAGIQLRCLTAVITLLNRLCIFPNSSTPLDHAQICGTGGIRSWFTEIVVYILCDFVWCRNRCSTSCCALTTSELLKRKNGFLSLCQSHFLRKAQLLQLPDLRLMSRGKIAAIICTAATKKQDGVSGRVLLPLKFILIYDQPPQRHYQWHQGPNQSIMITVEYIWRLKV